jgi:cell division protein FtsQ
VSKAEPLYHPMRPRASTRRKNKRRIVRALFKSIATVAIVAGAAWSLSGYFITSPRFALQNVEVSGLRVLSKEEVAQVAGLTSALNTLLLDPRSVTRKIESLPYVESCNVRRELFPNRVFINVKERLPSAILLYQNHSFEIDAEGRLLRELDPLMPLYLPIIQSEEVDALPAAGEKLDLPGILGALKLIDVYYATGLQEKYQLSEVSVLDQSTILMFADNVPYELRWGRGDFFAQAQRLEALLAAKGGVLPCKEYLDLRFDEDLICF